MILITEMDARKFYEKGNKTAGTRLRKALLISKTIAQDIRNQVTAQKNNK
ncbi:histone H1 [Pedobacter gandavensis]|nr:histone H1 [Pedobacter gandavensis]